METVKIVFDVDSKDIKSTTDELKALNKVTNEEVAAMERLSNAASDAGDGFVSLRTQVKQAKEEAQKAAEKYGEFSKEANSARQRAGELADQMGDLNRQVSLLNPEAKAKAFSNLAQGVVGAFSLATGALQAFGVKNKEVEALAMKLQGALNITQGIASIGQLKESFADLKIVLGFTAATQQGLTAAQKEQAIASAAAALGTTELTAAQQAEAIAAAEAELATKGFTAALLTNPIFLAVAAIAALAGAMIYLSKDTGDAVEKTEELKKAEETLAKSIQNQRTSWIDLQVAQGKLSKTQGEILKNNDAYAEKVKETNKVIAENKKQIQENASSYVFWGRVIDAILIPLAGLVGFIPGFGKALKEKLLGGLLESNKQIEEANKDLTESLKAEDKTRQNNNEIANTNNLNAQKEINKQKAKEREQELEKIKADAEKQYQEELKLTKAKQQNQVDEAATLEEKLMLQQMFALKNYESEKKHLEETGATITQLDQLWQDYYKTRSGLIAQQDKAIQDACDKELKAEEDLLKKLKGLNDKSENDPIKRIENETAAITAEYEKRLKAAQEHGNDTTQLTKEFNDFLVNQAQKTSDEQEKIRQKEKDQLAKDYKERLESAKELSQGIFDSLDFLGQTAFENRQHESDQELQNLEDQKNKKLITEEQYQAQLKIIKRKQAEDEKKQAIFNATIDLSRAIIAALTIPPPGSVVAASFAAALAGANLAKIIATPLPKYQKGTLAVPGVDMGRDSVHAMLQPGEAVIPVATNKAYHPAIKAIYEKKISPSEINSFVMSRTSSGGRQSITANVDTYALGKALGRNKGVQIENAQVVGKVIARELSNHNIRRA